MQKQKNYEDLTIRDHFMFGKICSKPENRKLILDSLLQIEFKEKSGDVEKHIQEFRDSKYSRLDLIAEDDDGIVYDAEMQNKSNDKTRQEELPKRSRYYQSLIDTAYFNAGGDYTKLPESYVIFICTFDPFGRELPIYTLKTTCQETNLSEYNDKAYKIFFNTTADLSNLPQSMRNMLEYINSGTTNDSATESIDNEVMEARLKEEWKAEYMLTLVHDKDVYNDGYVEGHDAGYEEGYASRQSEFDELANTISKNNLELERLTSLLKEHGIDPN